MLIRFLFANINFTVLVFSAFVFFITGWLYNDAAKVQPKNKNLIIRSMGFFLLALSFAAQAPSFNAKYFLLAVQWLEVAGLVIILISFLKESKFRSTGTTFLVLFAISFVSSFFSLIPIAAVLYLVMSLIYNLFSESS